MNAFRLLVSRCLQVVDDPSEDEVDLIKGLAHPEDLPILAAAKREACEWLVTFNIRHFKPGLETVKVLNPGDFIQRVRYILSALD